MSHFTGGWVAGTSKHEDFLERTSSFLRGFFRGETHLALELGSIHPWLKGGECYPPQKKPNSEFTLENEAGWKILSPFWDGDFCFTGELLVFFCMCPCCCRGHRGINTTRISRHVTTQFFSMHKFVAENPENAGCLRRVDMANTRMSQEFRING